MRRLPPRVVTATRHACERTLVPDGYRPTRRTARAGITVLAGLGLVTGIAIPLNAAHADPVYPSADQVAGAQAATAAGNWFKFPTCSKSLSMLP